MIIMFLSTTDAVQFFIDHRNFAFYIVYPVYLISSMRALLVLFIEMDRTFSAYFPITFFNYRKFIPTIFIIILLFVYALFDVSAMFLFCGDSIDVPPGCISIMCALSMCYRNYWLGYEQANRLALIDTFIIIVFDLIPPIIVSHVPNFYRYVGPVNAFFKTMGFVVEGYLVSINLRKRFQKSKTTIFVGKIDTSSSK
ncbi:hypothetical protein CRE_08776 [Caenorhabditis remanei]|uniref:Serpentine receptor class gamma n=1 Tax=Caenorhabditis remanei TaxID=31234 RepID=E3LHG6_CAERE|nr:hypothetical protein CRE_08776 [Caenorhabditis remanei]